MKKLTEFDFNLGASIGQEKITQFHNECLKCFDEDPLLEVHTHRFGNAMVIARREGDIVEVFEIIGYKSFTYQIEFSK
jgi:hypothetical protein